MARGGRFLAQMDDAFERKFRDDDETTIAYADKGQLHQEDRSVRGFAQS